MKIEKLIAVAKELNDLLFAPGDVNIPIKNVTETVLTDLIKEAAAELREDDELTAATAKVLESLGAWPPPPADETEEEDVDDDVDAVEDAEEIEEDEEEEEDEVEPEPAPKAKPAKVPAKAKPAPAVEEVEEDDEPEEEEELEDDDEDTPVDFTAMLNEIKATKKLALPERMKALKGIVKANPVFDSMVKTINGKFNAEEVRLKMEELLLKAERKAGALKPAPAPVPVPAKGKASMKVVKEKSAPAPKPEKAAPAPKPEKVKKEKPVFVKEKFNRLDCVLIALKEDKPKTITEWIKKANALHVAKGGVDNEQQTKHLVVNYGASLKHLGITVPTEK